MEKSFLNEEEFENNILDLNPNDIIKINNKIINDFSSKYLIVKFNIKDNSKLIPILGNFYMEIKNKISSIIIDNKKILICSKYKFFKTGEHILKYTFKDQETIPAGFLNGNQEITELYIPNYIKKIENTAFAGNQNLKIIKVFNCNNIILENINSSHFIMPAFYGINNCQIYLRTKENLISNI